MNIRSFSLVLIGLAMLLPLTGCGPRGIPLTPESDASSRWQAFAARSSASAEYDVLSGSLRFGPVNDTRRVTYLLWSGASDDGEPDDGHEPAGLDAADSTPGVAGDSRSVRLEVNAGVGANVAKVLFENGRMLLVLPQDRKAYAGAETPENLQLLLGLPLPMRMNDLNDFLAGRYLSALDVPAPERYVTGDDGNIIYRYRRDGMDCELELNAQALPVRWSVAGRWTLDLTYDEKELPRRMDGRMNSDEGELRMVLLVKERRPSGSLPFSSMHLEVPAAFAVYSLGR